MEKTMKLRKNPSREACEGIIKRILTAEVTQNGRNTHFRNASDFMNYFESLYPASDALTKQVQRAIRAMDMPKDADGFLVVNKTMDQFEQENTLKTAFLSAGASVNPMDNIETVFLAVPASMRTYLIGLIEYTDAFQGKYLTIAEVSGGLLFYTSKKSALIELLNSLTT
jgi:hypothetical protein